MSIHTGQLIKTTETLGDLKNAHVAEKHIRARTPNCFGTVFSERPKERLVYVKHVNKPDLAVYERGELSSAEQFLQVS